MSLIFDALQATPSSGRPTPTGLGFPSTRQVGNDRQIIKLVIITLSLSLGMGAAGWLFAASSTAGDTLDTAPARMPANKVGASALPALPPPAQGGPVAREQPGMDAGQLNALLRQMIANQARLETIHAQLVAAQQTAEGSPLVASARTSTSGFTLPVGSHDADESIRLTDSPPTPFVTPTIAPGSFVVQDRLSSATPSPRRKEDMNTATLVEAFDHAASKGDLSAATRHFESMRLALPAESMTLLRRQAWLHLYGGNEAAASTSYQAIVARLPGDENASLNLAILQARQGRIADARLLLQRVLDKHPGSQRVRDVMEQLGNEQ